MPTSKIKPLKLTFRHLCKNFGFEDNPLYGSCTNQKWMHNEYTLLKLVFGYVPMQYNSKVILISYAPVTALCSLLDGFSSPCKIQLLANWTLEVGGWD